MRVAILGAGAAGLALARQLRRFDGARIVIFERSARVGGLQRSVEIDDAHFDVGTFLFHEGHGMLDAFPEIRPDFVEIDYRPVSITPVGSFDAYPFSLGGYFRDNGWFWSGISVLDLLASKLLYFGSGTMRGYAKYYTGGTIYRRSGLQHYIRRLHDENDSQIDIEFARRRLHVLSRNSLRSTARKVLSRAYRNRARGQIRKRLVRPVSGLDGVYARIRALVEKGGAELVRIVDDGCLAEWPSSIRQAGRVKDRHGGIQKRTLFTARTRRGAGRRCLRSSTDCQ